VRLHVTKMVRALLNGKYRIILPEHRAKRPEWYQPGGWEKARLDHMHRTTKKGDTVYYVGAEEGEMCALLQMWGALLYMFEPNPLVWPNIKAIFDANDLANPCRSYVAFAANQTDNFVLWNMQWPPDRIVNGPVISDHGFKNLCEWDGTIPRVKIDDIVMTGMGRVPQMISLDVEGAEWEVLRGAEQTLRKHHPRIYLSLHPEFMYEIYKEYAFDLRNWLKGMGYTETLLDYQHEVHLYYEYKEAK
jgi:FkbM family methyltransferase